ncbi:MAG: family 43 glycosylhydrolase, partial [Acidimicrobiales bacterium]|nr:family 43 glycosylhydrolase [Acidimicrobiales bacterium]
FTYQNADPAVVSLGPLMFTYATNHGGADLPITWSADGHTWTARTQYEGAAAHQDGDVGYFNDGFPNVPWGVDYNRCNGATPGCDPKEMWAPSVGFIGGRWIGFHAVKIAREPAYSSYGRFAIYASVADNPLGPFRAASSRPIVTTSTSSDPAGAIDPEVYVEETTGKAYLIWKTEGNRSGNFPSIWSRQLSSSGTSFAAGSSARRLITVSQRWEGNVVENPSLTKVNGRYILLYSGNNHSTTSYATGYAVCSGPLGPCTKSSSNPILRSTTGAYGTGGADGIVDDRGRFVAVYHAWTGASGGRGTGRRVQHVAELAVASNGYTTVKQRDLASGRGYDSVWYHDRGGAYSAKGVSIGGNYQIVAGDYSGDGRDDLAFYGAWTRADTMWLGGGNRSFTTRAFNQVGTFLPLSGDFDGDGDGDIYWYQPGPDPIVADRSRAGSNYEPNARNDQLWLSTGTGWTVRDLSVAWAAIPVVGDFDGNGADDIIWSQPGSAPDRLWLFGSDGQHRSVAISIWGNYRPVVGDFDGNGVDDIFWYGPGSAADSVWWFNASGGYSSTHFTVTGDRYRPFAGDFDGDGRDEITWYHPGRGYDSIWTGISRGRGYSTRGTVINGVYTVVVGDYDGNGVDDILWYS